MAWKHTRNSHNIASYRDEGTKRWASVLCDTIERVEGRIQLTAKPTYHVTVYEEGVGEIGRINYRPARRPNPINLSPRTVARLVREATA